jgi:hypothetical protein
MQTITGNLNLLADTRNNQIPYILNSDSVTIEYNTTIFLLFTVVRSNVDEISKYQIDHLRH